MAGEPSHRKRGRPPHPDILTPREWQVLDLLRQGLTNEQIAQRLDISFATAKYHVAEIISKLGVQTREQAAAWQPPLDERTRWQRAFAPLAAVVLRRVGPLTLTKAAIVAAASAAMIWLAMFVWASGDDDEHAAVAEPTTTVSSTPRPTVTQVRSPPPTSPPPTETPVAIVDPTRVFANLPGPLEEKPVLIEPGRELRLVGGIYRTTLGGDNITQIAGPDDPAAGSHFAFSVRSLSADGRWLAFAVRTPTNRATRGEPVFLKDLTNSAPARPLAVFGRVRYLAISPDGQRLIVEGAVDPPSDPGYVDTAIYVIDVEEHTISTLPQLADAYSIDWSPTGEHLAFRRSSQSGGGSNLYVASADWSDIRELPSSEGAVAWSPDGSRLAFVACCGKGIHIATPDGGSRYLTQITPHSGPYNPSEMSWSPDGSRLAFHAHDPSLGGFAISIVDAENGSAETLGAGEAPVWSRDGGRLAYVKDGELFVSDLGSDDIREVAHPAQPFMARPRWSFDSSAVLFHYAPWFLRSIRSVQASGDEQHLAYGDDPVWSPDASRIAFIGRVLSAGLAGSNEIYVMNADGTGAHKVGNYGWADVGTCPAVLSWSADDNYVKFSGSQGVFVTPADGSSSQRELDEPCPSSVGQSSDTAYSPDGSDVLIVR
jgi:Tol biopolymer transport system component/DNA-binding CsgD family transcriptional regulator